ncbi:hypothetical protein LCGC14_0580750 [marine sediment metagenome]|uniref:Uncharacterized protein n=1 Tax=marine sediment metagenome TaxID=412755 RepID=A0A0F9UPS0_9ZZZZ
MSTELQQAIDNLQKANDSYTKESKGKDDNDLYVKIVGPAWRKYLAVGGSRTMINL